MRTTGFDLPDARITAIEDPDSTCTRADVPLSGRVESPARTGVLSRPGPRAGMRTVAAEAAAVATAPLPTGG